MIISSKDIKKRDFKKAIRGYDTDEVDAFLETVSSHYEKLVLENKAQSDRIKSLLQDINIYKENEINLQKAIIKSQEIGEEVISNAKRKAELIVKEADIESRFMKQKLEDEILSKKQELEEIKQRNEKTFDDMKHFLMEKLNELDEFTRNRKIINMELTNLKNIHFATDEEEIPEIDHKNEPLKKIYMPPQSLNDEKSFDDSFEIK